MKVKRLLALISVYSKKNKNKYARVAYLKLKKNILRYDINEKITKIMVTNLDITQHMKDKLLDFMTMNPTNEIKRYELYEELNLILGIGPTKATQLITLGLSKIEDLINPKWFKLLSREAKIMVTYKPCRKIPRSIIQKIEPILTGFKRERMIIVGSYRRRKKFSRDIDIVMTMNLKTFDLYEKYIRRKYNIHVYSKGATKMSFLLQFDKIYYKVDIFRVTPTEILFMILYATGSSEFNIKMRRIAKHKGFILNQKGLFDKKTHKRIKVKSEKDLFNILNMTYTKPSLR
jgi:hypothetical protein